MIREQQQNQIGAFEPKAYESKTLYKIYIYIPTVANWRISKNISKSIFLVGQIFQLYLFFVNFFVPDNLFSHYIAEIGISRAMNQTFKCTSNGPYEYTFLLMYFISIHHNFKHYI